MLYIDPFFKILSLKAYNIGDKIIKNSAKQKIAKRISDFLDRSAFATSDFTDITDYQNAKKCLLRLEKEHKIRRVLRGIYDKPHFSTLLGELSRPHLEEVAKAIARNNAWKIAPTGVTSLNLLGLSTQVPSNYEYYSTGPYKTYDIGGTCIRFLHRSSKNLVGLSDLSLLVVSAIKEIGPEISKEDKTKIARRIGEDGKAALLSETSMVTKWVYEVIKDICR